MHIGSKKEANALVGTKVTVTGDSVHHRYPIGKNLTIKRIDWDDDGATEVQVMEGSSYVSFMDVEPFLRDIAFFEKQLEELAVEKERVLNDMEEVRVKISLMNKYKLTTYDENLERAQLIYDRLVDVNKDTKAEDAIKSILDALK